MVYDLHQVSGVGDPAIMEEPQFSELQIRLLSRRVKEETYSKEV